MNGWDYLEKVASTREDWYQVMRVTLVMWRSWINWGGKSVIRTEIKIIRSFFNGRSLFLGLNAYYQGLISTLSARLANSRYNGNVFIHAHTCRLLPTIRSDCSSHMCNAVEMAALSKITWHPSRLTIAWFKEPYSLQSNTLVDQQV